MGTRARPPRPEPPLRRRQRAHRLAACLAFLWPNDHELEAGEDELTDLMIGVAAGRVSKAQVAVFLEEHSRPEA